MRRTAAAPGSGRLPRVVSFRGQDPNGEELAAVDLWLPRQDRRGDHAGPPPTGMDDVPGTCLGHPATPGAPLSAITWRSSDQAVQASAPSILGHLVRRRPDG